MKAKLGALAIGILAVGLVGCSSAEPAPTAAEACDEIADAYGPVVTSFSFIASAQSKDAAEVHLASAEESLADMGEVEGPDEFLELRDDLVAKTQLLVDESRKTLTGDDSGIDRANAGMLEAASSLDQYCGT